MNMWLHVKACCLNSMTIAWTYCLALIGTVMQAVDTVGDIIGDPNFKEQLAAAIGEPKTVGRILLATSVVTAIARLRSLRKQS